MVKRTTQKKLKVLRNLNRRERTTKKAPKTKNRDQKKLFEGPKKLKSEKHEVSDTTSSNTKEKKKSIV